MVRQSISASFESAVRRSISDTSGVDGRVVTKDGTERYLDAYRIEVGAWVDGIRTGTPTRPTAWDGHRANVAAFTAVESLHGAGRVEIAREETPALYR